MKSTLKITLLATISALISAQDYPEVSRADKDIRFLMQVSTAGASTPETLYNKTKNSKEEPHLANYLTPLGQRQQYLIGSEFRTRYIDEQQNQFLNYSYNIEEIWIQTTFDQKTILSAQAQLLGMYPPSTYNNFLNEWQQTNAVPPMNNTPSDIWNKWQEELGDLAVLGGFNVFPINMEGPDDDTLLNLNARNCKLFAEGVTQNYNEFKDMTKGYEKFQSALSQKFGNSYDFTQAETFAACEYLQWADLHGVDLDVQISSNDLKTCSEFIATVNNYYLQVSKDLNNIASMDFLKYLKDHVKSAADLMPFNQTIHYKKLLAQYERDLPNQLGDTLKKPYYVFFVTNDLNLRYFVSSLVGLDEFLESDLGKQSFVASSTMIVEVLTNDDDDIEVEVYFNDEPLPLKCANGATSVKAQDLVDYLESLIVIDNVKSECQNKEDIQTMIK